MCTPSDRPGARNAAGRLRKLRRKRTFRSRGRLARPLNAAGQERVEAHTWLAYQLAWQFARRRPVDLPVDELIAEAFYGLTYASALFKEEFGVPFGAYARIAIRHRLIQRIISWRRLRRASQIPLLSTPTGPLELETEERPRPDLCSSTAAKEMCERVREVLPARLYEALRLYHGEGYTLEEIGSRLGITRQRVRQLFNIARDQVRQCFPEWTRY